MQQIWTAIEDVGPNHLGMSGSIARGSPESRRPSPAGSGCLSVRRQERYALRFSRPVSNRHTALGQEQLWGPAAGLSLPSGPLFGAVGSEGGAAAADSGPVGQQAAGSAQLQVQSWLTAAIPMDNHMLQL